MITFVVPKSTINESCTLFGIITDPLKLAKKKSDRFNTCLLVVLVTVFIHFINNNNSKSFLACVSHFYRVCLNHDTTANLTLPTCHNALNNGQPDAGSKEMGGVGDKTRANSKRIRLFATASFRARNNNDNADNNTNNNNYYCCYCYYDYHKLIITMINSDNNNSNNINVIITIIILIIVKSN